MGSEMCIRDSADTSLDYDKLRTWCSDGTLDVSKTPIVQSSYLIYAKQQLQITLGLSSSRTFLSSGAVFKRGYGCSSYYSHERIRIGDVVQVLVSNYNETSQFISASTYGSGYLGFF